MMGPKIYHSKIEIAGNAARADDGFTLIEVLISLFIFALISFGTLTALTQSLRGKTRLDTAVSHINRINSARAIMRADMSAATLRPIRDELGGVEPYSLTTDGEALLTFIRRGRENPGGLEKRGDLERIQYILSDRNFIRRSFSHENPSSDPQFFDRVLLEDVQDVKLSAHIAGTNTQNSNTISSSTEFFRVPPDTPSPNIPSPDRLSEVPAALSFEITDKYNDVTTHYFELDL